MNEAIAEYRYRVFRKVGLELRPQMLVLDIGCGEGHDAADFSRMARVVIGLDIQRSEMWPQLARRNGKLNFLIADMRFLPFKEETFDLIYEKDTLHHTDAPEQALAALFPIIKKDGLIVCVESNKHNPFSYIHMVLLRGHSHFSRRDFQRLIVNCASSVTFSYFEAHVIPLRCPLLRRLFYRIEDLLERISIFRPFLSYNVALCRKERMT